MSTWTKRDNSNSVKDVVMRNTNLTEEEFLNPKQNYFVAGIKEAASLLYEYVAKKAPIYIYGDYDADGITSVSILLQLLSFLHAENCFSYIPKRFTDGYGLTMRYVEEICSVKTSSEALLVTVDNGIVAVDEIEYAKKHGFKVIVIDHHLPREDGLLPSADVIVNPHAVSGSEFCDYCGAGLAFKLAQEMIDDQMFLDKISTLAAIGTICDVMPLLGDNRNIVKKGLHHLNKGNTVLGLRVLFGKLSIYHLDESDIGFKIGPILNACGRMYNDGANTARTLLTTTDFKKSQQCCDEMIETNDLRKNTVRESVEECKRIISENCLYGETPLVVYTTSENSYRFHEGIVGILAGRLSEEFNCPAIVLTETENGMLKGSGRSSTAHLKELLDAVASEFDSAAKTDEEKMKYGGHAGAAGVSVPKHRILEFIEMIQSKVSDFEGSDDENQANIFYDLEINAENLADVYKELETYAPYGEGNPRPIFKIDNIKLIPHGGKFYRLMGDQNQHLKLFGNEYDVVAFDKAEQYINMGTPISLQSIGCISKNYFGGDAKLQIEASEITAVSSNRTSTSLADAIAARMKSKGLKI